LGEFSKITWNKIKNVFLLKNLNSNLHDFFLVMNVLEKKIIELARYRKGNKCTLFKRLALVAVKQRNTLLQEMSRLITPKM